MDTLEPWVLGNEGSTVTTALNDIIPMASSIHLAAPDREHNDNIHQYGVSSVSLCPCHKCMSSSLSIVSFAVKARETANKINRCVQLPAKDTIKSILASLDKLKDSYDHLEASTKEAVHAMGLSVFPNIDIIKKVLNSFVFVATLTVDAITSERGMAAVKEWVVISQTPYTDVLELSKSFKYAWWPSKTLWVTFKDISTACDYYIKAIRAIRSRTLPACCISKLFRNSSAIIKKHVKRSKRLSFIPELLISVQKRLDSGFVHDICQGCQQPF